jgi:pimeloyl-ACP methyl ester carboxylesterase
VESRSRARSRARNRVRAICATAAVSLLIPGVAAAAPAGAPDRTAARLAHRAELPPVVARQIAITDPWLGRLTFDALASGDPAAARRGRLVLFLHGFPETDESFRAILPVIAAAGYYAVAPDQRGYSPGARPTDVGDYNLLHLVGDTLSMATALGADRFHLVGHDWGGAVAWLTAALAPGRLSSMAALSTPHPDALAEAYDDPNGVQKSMLGYLQVVTIPGIQNVLLALGPGFFADALTLMGCPYDEAVSYASTIGTPDALGAALDWYRANPIPAAISLGPISVPTLYIWGSADFALSREAAEDTAQFVHAPYQFVALEGVNHFVPENAPGVVARLVLGQVRQTG